MSQVVDIIQTLDIDASPAIDNLKEVVTLLEKVKSLMGEISEININITTTTV